MSITIFNYSFYIISICWCINIILNLLCIRSTKAIYIKNITAYTGIAILVTYVTFLWISLERAPLLTLGETRLWYSVFLSICGLLICKLNKEYNFILPVCLALSLIFLAIDFLNPVKFDKTTMPAIQSFWFIPHVASFILSYSILGIATILSFVLTLRKNSSKSLTKVNSILNMGVFFLTMGLILGFLWAKTAWGHYWSWDPKETWALLTWAIYLFYIHINIKYKNLRVSSTILFIAFFVLLITWFGVNYLDIAKESMHTYGN